VGVLGEDLGGHVQEGGVRFHSVVQIEPVGGEELLPAGWEEEDDDVEVGRGAGEPVEAVGQRPGEQLVG
jgi:hypothetical protein